MQNITFYIDSNNILYTGDLQPSDRLATPEEIIAHFGEPLENAKTEARTTLSQKRKAIEYGGFELEGQHWGSDEKDEVRLASALRRLQNNVTEIQGWKISADLYITLTRALAEQAAEAMLDHYSRVYALEAKKLAELEKLDSPEAIKNWLETELEKDW